MFKTGEGFKSLSRVRVELKEDLFYTEPQLNNCKPNMALLPMKAIKKITNKQTNKQRNELINES